MLIGEIEAEPVRERRFCHQLTFILTSNFAVLCQHCTPGNVCFLTRRQAFLPGRSGFLVPPPPGSSSPLARCDRWAPPAPPAPPERDHCGSCCSRITLLTSNPRKSSRFGGAGGAVGFVASRGFLVRHQSATEAPPKGLRVFFSVAQHGVCCVLLCIDCGVL